VADAVPHLAAQEDEYNGLRIPKGAMIMANSWGINRDPEAFGSNDLEAFIPERWLEGRSMAGDLRNDLPTPTFGYGRRMCAGKKIAEDSMWLQVSRLLWAFKVECANSEMIDPDDTVRHTFTVVPREFKINLTPRDPNVPGIVLNSWDMTEKNISNLLGEVP
jgi:cytochrome P450